jgi:hypothetical protein
MARIMFGVIGGAMALGYTVLFVIVDKSALIWGIIGGAVALGWTVLFVIVSKSAVAKRLGDWLARNEDGLRDTSAIVIFFALLFLGWDCVPHGDDERNFVLAFYVLAGSLGMAAFVRHIWKDMQYHRKTD